MDFERWINLIAPFDEPTSRLYHVNILSALLVTLLWIILNFLPKLKQSKFPIRKLLKLIKLYLFSYAYWWNPSTRKDYLLFFINGFLKSIFFIPLISISFITAQQTLSMTHFFFGEMVMLPLNGFFLVLFAFAVFVFDDALRFYHHFLMHKIPLLWRFHKTHHEATVLTPFTLFRTHPVESLMGSVRNGIVLGISSGVFVYLFKSPLTVWTIMGVNGFGYFFNLFAANLRHSQIPISFGFFENFIISPKQHQIHHSNQKKYFGKNLGVNLSIWDKLHNTNLLTKNIDYNTKISFGNQS